MSEWKIRFGTAGTSDSFTAMGYKNSLDIPAYTEKMGLDAFEYQCGHGVRLGLDKARQMADDAAARGILFSVHAPYYISASSLDEEKRLNSINYILDSCRAVKSLGGRRRMRGPGCQHSGRRTASPPGNAANDRGVYQTQKICLHVHKRTSAPRENRPIQTEQISVFGHTP